MEGEGARDGRLESESIKTCTLYCSNCDQTGPPIVSRGNHEADYNVIVPYIGARLQATAKRGNQKNIINTLLDSQSTVLTTQL